MTLGPRRVIDSGVGPLASAPHPFTISCWRQGEMSFSHPKGATTAAAASLRFIRPSYCFPACVPGRAGAARTRLADLRVFAARVTGVTDPAWASLGTWGSIWSQSQRCLCACRSDEERCCRFSNCILQFALSQLLRRKLNASLINFTLHSLFNYFQMSQQINVKKYFKFKFKPVRTWTIHLFIYFCQIKCRAFMCSYCWSLTQI